MNDKVYEVLAKIAELASSIADEATVESAEESVPIDSPSPKYLGCIIKNLPKRLVAKSAETAIKINPMNGVTFGHVADFEGVLEPAMIAVLVQKYWGPTPRQITVSFMDNPTPELRRKLLSHFNAWTKTGCIEFVETNGTGQVRVSRGPGGYYSYLGTDILHIPKNQQTMNLEDFTINTSESEFKRVVRHEVGHSLGYPHEHMRQQLIARLDPQKTYEYFRRTQGWDQQTVDQQVLTPLEERSIRGTPTADQESIMCYQLPGEITLDGQPITGGDDINQLDYDFCGRIYPKATDPPPPPPPLIESGNAIAKAATMVVNAVVDGGITTPPPLGVGWFQNIIKMIMGLLGASGLCGLTPAAAQRRMTRQGPLERRAIRSIVRENEDNPAMWYAEQRAISQVGSQLTVDDYSAMMQEAASHTTGDTTITNIGAVTVTKTRGE